MRFFVLCAACWCAILALMHVVQITVMIAPASLQPSLTLAWAFAATVYAPIAAWIIERCDSAHEAEGV